MKRLYYLFQGSRPARTITDDLLTAGLDEGQLHFMARNPAELKSANLHTTNILEECDAPQKGAYGGIIGLGVGMIFALYLLIAEFDGRFNFGLLLMVSLLFTCFGIWAGGMIGASQENHHVARFHEALESGDTLLMLDTYNPDEEQKAKRIMHDKHLEAKYEGEEENYNLVF